MWAVALVGLAGGTPAGAVTSAGAAVSGGPAIGVSPLAAQPVQVINDNGGWCWFQGARAVIGGDGRLLVGSTASSTGAGGSARSGAVEVASFDLRTGTVTQTDRLTGPGQYRSDDHNSPGLAEVAGGRVVAAWAGHNDDWRKQSATLDPTDAAWTVNAATIRGRSTTYSNLLRLPAENGGKGRLYDFFRAEGSAVNAMISDDDGRTWVDAGRLVSNGTLHPYTRFAANGPDRIDFITTSGNPQSVRGSGVRSGFLKGGRIYTTDGRQVGSLGAGVEWGALAPLQLGVPALEGADTDVWTADLVVGPDGPVAALTVKHPRPPNVTGRSFDQEYLYASWTGGAWNVQHVAWGGSELYAEQPSYSGNLVIDPADVSRVYLSSNVNPVDGSALLSAADGAAHWEVYDALTSDAGATWSISSVTKNSVSDNIRPVAVAGHGASALLWMRGTYHHFRTFNTAIVGVVNAGPLGTSSVPRAVPTRLARTASVVTGNWTGGPSAGLFVLGTASTASGFVLPAGRGQRHPFVAVTLRGTYSGFRADLTGSGRDGVILVDSTPGRSAAARTTLVASLGADQSVRLDPLQTPAGATPVVGDSTAMAATTSSGTGPGPAPTSSGRARRAAVGP